jgi:transposase-like protein
MTARKDAGQGRARTGWGRKLPGKRHTTDEIEGKLRQIEALVNQGKTLGEATKAVGVSRQTLYRWRGTRAGDDNSSDRLRDLEAENIRLRKLVTDLLLQKMALEEQLRRA